ncbi:hypothetical protein BUALT_Bualt03G0103700 [Buddleja alternifolia]|uniref:Aminotransferase-like plant mobile domain-containing protein n=1 Tax=Buddleja alternifolia TaxID=168488 RepID=A0AAV6Y0R2_9LAMI|nr:hypothetical protein BUALT_Bualt03G0103700 [Buddleja alternifolia]
MAKVPEYGGNNKISIKFTGHNEDIGTLVKMETGLGHTLHPGPIDDSVLILQDHHRSTDIWNGQDFEPLTCRRPPPEDFDRGRLKIRCLQERFKTLPDGASEETVKFYARAYILQLLGGQLLSDMSNNKVKLMYLPLLRDFEAAGRLSWGGAVLACLYRALCRATKPETSDICGPLVLLQIWAWERVPFIRPGRLAPRQQPPPDIVSGEHPLPDAPYGSRWNVGFKLETVGTHVLFVWEPYPVDVLASLPEYCISGKRIWQTVSPLICFDVVEFHHPDRVLRQFGQQQSIPAICDTIPDIHLTDRRGRQNYDWAHHHRQFVDMWADRCARVISAPPVDRPMDQSDAYMIWYRRITRLLIGNPATRPNTGYQGVGGAMEAMAQSLQKIYHRATDAMQEGYEVSGEDILREIQDICAYSLRAAREDHRLTLRPDLTSPSPAASPFAPPKVQRGRPRKRGGFASGQASESRKRSPYVCFTPSTSLAVPHSPLSSNMLSANVGEPADTPQTWDSSISASEFQDATDPNAMQLDSEATASTNPIEQALRKIREICAFTLRMSNGNQALISSHDSIPVGPKTKRCKPRRRGGMSGYLVDASAGINAYFPCDSGPSSPAPSASLGPCGSPSQPHDSPAQDVEPLVTPLSRDSPLPELQEDNLQLEMIELDTITGSREASPSPPDQSMLELTCDPPANQDSLLSSPGVKTNFPPENNATMVIDTADTAQPPVTGQKENRTEEVLPPISDPPASEPCVETPVEPDYIDNTKFNETPSSPQGDANGSQATPKREVSPVHENSDMVVKEVNEPVLLEPESAETLTPSDSAIPVTEDSKPSSQQGDENINEPSLPTNQGLSVHSVSDDSTMKVDGPESEIIEGGREKRKEQATDNAISDSPNPDSKSPLKSLVEGESQVNKTDPAAVKEERKYKRQRRSVPKPRASTMAEPQKGFLDWHISTPRTSPSKHPSSHHNQLFALATSA